MTNLRLESRSGQLWELPLTTDRILDTLRSEQASFTSPLTDIDDASRRILPRPPRPSLAAKMTALFNFTSLCLVFCLVICTSTYMHQIWPSIMDRNKDGFIGIFWKCARIGERLSPYVSIFCVFMAVSLLIPAQHK